MGESTGPLVAGADFGPYRILREIGGGGMGVVYEAADDALDRTVALKVIAPQLAGDPEFRERFRREAQALGALDSPRVVQVHAYGEVGGRLYIATQLAPDGDLGAWLHEFGPPPVEVALDLVAQVAGGLADAHDAGLVHRDLKPANVLLRRQGTALAAYLGDFGIARRLRHDDAGADDTGTAGTPSYMAPELHTGAPADARSDIYSLGCLLWATLTGHPPYRRATDDQVVSAHFDQPVPQLSGTSAPTTELNRILRTAMAKDPANRYSGAAQLGEDLRRVTTLPDRPRTRAGATSRRSRVTAVAALAIAGLVVVGVLGLAGDDQEVAAAGGATERSGEPAGEERAAASLTRALVAERVVTDRRQAACTARAWIDDVGLARLLAAGYFTDEMEYVDLEIDQVPDGLRLSLAAAGLTCLAA